MCFFKISIAYQSISAVFELWKHAKDDIMPCNTFRITTAYYYSWVTEVINKLYDMYARGHYYPALQKC